MRFVADLKPGEIYVDSDGEHQVIRHGDMGMTLVQNTVTFDRSWIVNPNQYPANN